MVGSYTDIQIKVEAIDARQLQEERRCADKLRLREQLEKLQVSASQGLCDLAEACSRQM